MTEHYQQNLMGKPGQKCRQCGNEEFFITASGICQRCDYNNIFGKNISKEEMDESENKSHEEFLREVNEGRYILKRGCSICNEFIEINAIEDNSWDNIEKFMNEHRKKHYPLEVGWAMGDIHMDKIEIVKEE